MSQDVLERPLSRDELIALKNRRLGMTIFQMSWIMVFVCLVVVNFLIRANFPTWPPAGVSAPDALLATAATLVLLASVWTARAGVLAIQRDDRATLAQQWGITLLLGVVFIGIMGVQWLNAPLGEGAAQQYGTIYRMMIAYHLAHTLVIGLFMLSIYQKRALYNRRNFWGVEAGAKLWYFVVVAWVLFYIVLYLV